jgi:hypothetical protein
MQRGLACTIATVAVLFSAASVVNSQAQPVRAFETLTFGLSGAAPLGGSILHEGWNPPWGMDVSIATPFYAGRTQGGVQVLYYQAHRPTVVDFLARYVYLDWRLVRGVHGPLEIGGGFRFGMFQMSFKDAEIMANLRHEQEVRADLVAGLRVRLGGGWALDLTGSYGTIFLEPHVRQGAVAVGFRRTVPTPEWLQEVLR